VHISDSDRCQEKAHKQALEETVNEVVSKRLNNDKDLDNRKKNIILYRVPEVVGDGPETRKAKDSEMFQSLCRDSLGIQMTEGDISKMFRLGKNQSSDRPRPLLVGFRDESKKTELMKNLSKLKSAQECHRSISIAHDLAPGQRDEIRKALEEARRQAGAGSSQMAGNLKFKVVGLGSRIRILRKELH
jgi:hypothetical protein